MSLSNMNKNFHTLRDPFDGSCLRVEGSTLASDESGKTYPIVAGIPRFVSADNYSADFGSQWKMFPKTQLDSFSGVRVSEARLARCLGGDLTVLKDKAVLEAGSGAGRFTEILLKFGAKVSSFDFSSAVEANASNNGSSEQLLLVQADVRHIPFQKAYFDYVVCLGVLQHTPDPEQSIRCLWEMLKPGGSLIVDHYPWKWRIVIPPPIGEALAIYRRFILLLRRSVRFRAVEKLTNFWFPFHWAMRDSPFAQRILRRLSPVIFHYPDVQLRDRQMFYEWALLDTHDATTDVYKHRRTRRQIEAALNEIGATNIVVTEGGNGIEALCRKPSGAIEGVARAAQSSVEQGFSRA